MKKKMLLILLLFLSVLFKTQIILAAGSFAYVPDYNSGDLFAIDVTRDTVIGPIKLGLSAPYGVAISPDGTKIYVTNSANGTVAVIDGTKDPDKTSVLGTIKVGANPHGIAVSPDGTKVYVANTNSDTLSIIDATKDPNDPNAILGTIKTGKTPIGVAVSSSEHRIYVSSFGGAVTNGSITIIDANKTPNDPGIILGTLLLEGIGASGITLSPDEKRIYVSYTLSSFFSVIDATTNLIQGKINVSSIFRTIASPDGTKIYAADSNANTLSVIDATKPLNDPHAILGTIQVGKGPIGVALTPNGTKIYVANSGDGTVSVIDATKVPNNGAVIATLNVGKNPYAFGNFIASIGSLKLSKSNIDFGSQRIGSTSAPQSFTLTNTGGGVINFSQVSSSPLFAVINDCNIPSIPLAAGKTCNFSATFSPTSEGVQSYNLTFTDDANGSPHLITLTGAGIMEDQGSSSGDKNNEETGGSGCSLMTTNHHSSPISLLLLLPIFLGYVVWKDR